MELLQACIFLLLSADVLTDRGLVTPNGRHEISSGPKVLPHEAALSFSINPRQVDGALAFDKTHHLRHRIFGWDRDHHMHMIRHQMAFLDLAFLLPCQSPQDLPKVSAQLTIQRLPSAL